MSTQPTPGQTLADLNAEEALHYRAILRQMVDIGMDMLTGLQQSTKEADQSIPYERITRAMRRTVLLAQKLAEPPAKAAKPDRTKARRRIIREVEDQIERHSYRDNIDPDALRVELGDRLDSPDLEEDLKNFPLEEIITHLCSDLGVGQMPNARINEWRRRTPDDIQALLTRGPAPTPPQTSQPQTGSSPSASVIHAKTTASPATAPPQPGHLHAPRPAPQIKPFHPPQ